jgi:probable DNA metabolism protein
MKMQYTSQSPRIDLDGALHATSLQFLYDKTFEGLLTAVFDAFFRKQIPDKIVASGETVPLFTETHEVATDPEKAGRVLAGLKKKISKSAIQMLFVCHLYEMDNVETRIFHYIRKAFAAGQSIELNFADPDVLELSKIYKKVKREEEKVRQFVRFQKTADGVFFACIEPIYNVLLSTKDFFEDRFADQSWLIYDVRRQYGLYYDRKETNVVRFDRLNFSPDTGQLLPEQMDGCEIDFQELWRQYFRSTAIKERINLRLQRQFMPKRFWKYLTEKNGNLPKSSA